MVDLSSRVTTAETNITLLMEKMNDTEAITDKLKKGTLNNNRRDNPPIMQAMYPDERPKKKKLEKKLTSRPQSPRLSP